MFIDDYLAAKLASRCGSFRYCSWNALFLGGCLAACSFKDVTYLSTGDSVNEGGVNHSGGMAGESNRGGSSGEAGAGDGGTSGSSTNAGGGGAECGSNQVACSGQSECVDLSKGSASGDIVENCGNCGTSCSLSNAKNASCVVGACKPTCNDGFGDCNEASLNDGCESELSTVTACGDCGRVCSTVGVSTKACTAGKCAPVCLPNHADCNQDSGKGTDDGCEMDLSSLTHCGTNCTNGVSCAVNQVCNTDGCGAPKGVAVLSIPFTTAGEGMRFANKFPAMPDLANESVTVRVYAPGATGGAVTLYMSDGDYTAGPGVSIPLSTLAEKWTDIAVRAGTTGGSYDPSVVTQINIEIRAEAPGPYTNPTVIYVDRVWSSEGSIDDLFSTSSGQISKSSLMVVAGATLSWLETVP